MAILTISREMGTEGLSIGRTISEAMGYAFLDKDKILEELRKDGVTWERVGKELDEKAPTLWEKYDRQYSGLVALTQRHILEYALAESIVLMGRGGNFLFEGIPFALRVRIIAPMEARLLRKTKERDLSDFSSLDEKAIRSVLEKTDKDRENMIKAFFNRSWNDPKAYDITFNMAILTAQEVIDTIKAILVERDRFRSPQAEDQLKNRAIAAKIKAVIKTHPDLSIPTLEVYSSGDEIILRGRVHSAREHKLVEEEAKKIAGAIPIKYELLYR
jgi:cytidylate kinase